MTWWLGVLVLLAGTATAQVYETRGPCSPNIVGNRGAVHVHINGPCIALQGLEALRDMAVTGEVAGPPPDTSPAIFQQRVALPRASFSYREFVQAIIEIQGAVARISGVPATRESRESLIIGQDRDPNGRIVLLGLDADTMARVVNVPARGFRYLYEAPVGAIRKVEIAYQDADGEKLGEYSGRSLHVTTSDAAVLANMIGVVQTVFDRQPRWQALLVGLLSSDMVIITVSTGLLLVGLTFFVWGVVRLFREGERAMGLATLALTGSAGAAWIGFLASAGSFPSLVPDHGLSPMVVVLLWLGGALTLSLITLGLNWWADM